MAYDEVLAERIRERLNDAAGVTEKKMFGGVAFLTSGNMTVTDHAHAQRGIRTFDFTGRQMRGWILVAGDALDDKVLDRGSPRPDLSCPPCRPGGRAATDVGRKEHAMAVVFRGRVRRWDEQKSGGLAVVDVPPEAVDEIGGRRQMRVTGTLQGTPFTGSTMLVAGGGLCVGVSKAALKAAGASVGGEVELAIAPAGR